MEWNISHAPIPFPEALATMQARVAAIHAHQADELVWLLEHPPLYTSGTSAKPADLLDSHRFPVYEAGRGGQYTYHGPGQRIAYVMLDLKKRAEAAKREPDLRFYVQQLERWIIETLAEFGVKGELREGRIGVWVAHAGTEKKIAALGVRVQRWISFHGIAINLNPDLSHFSGIIPCGISNYGVTSLHELGIPITITQLDESLKRTFAKIFS